MENWCPEIPSVILDYLCVMARCVAVTDVTVLVYGIGTFMVYGCNGLFGGGTDTWTA